MSTTTLVAAAILETFPAHPVALAAAASVIPAGVLVDRLRGRHPFRLAELHRLAIATGQHVTDLDGRD